MGSTVETLFYILTALGIILIISILGFVNIYIRCNIDKIKNSTEFDLLNWIQFTIIPNTVDALNQTLADSYKLANEDGKLTKEEADELFRMALASVYSQLSDDVKNKINPLIGDLDAWLTNSIEQYIYNSKDNNNKVSILEPIVNVLKSEVEETTEKEDETSENNEPQETEEDSSVDY